MKYSLAKKIGMALSAVTLVTIICSISGTASVWFMRSKVSDMMSVPIPLLVASQNMNTYKTAARVELQKFLAHGESDGKCYVAGKYHGLIATHDKFELEMGKLFELLGPDGRDIKKVWQRGMETIMPAFDKEVELAIIECKKYCRFKELRIPLMTDSEEKEHKLLEMLVSFQRQNIEDENMCLQVSEMKTAYMHMLISDGELFSIGKMVSSEQRKGYRQEFVTNASVFKELTNELQEVVGAPQDQTMLQNISQLHTEMTDLYVRKDGIFDLYEQELKTNQQKIVHTKRIDQLGQEDWEMAEEIVKYTNNYLDSSEERIKQIAAQTTVVFVLVVLASLSACLLVRALVLKFIVRRIQKLTKATTKIANGDLEYEVDFISSDEIGELSKNFNIMREKLKSSISKLKDWNKTLEKQVSKQTKELSDKNTALLKEFEATQLAERKAYEAWQKAEAATQVKSEFLANMSHEIRTPMNAIIGFADILTDEDLTEDQHNYVEMVSNSGENLLLLINDILDFSKIEAGKLEVDMIEFCLNEKLEEIQSLFSLQVEDKGIEFKVNISNDVPSEISSDPSRLYQCLVNLINNSVKFTDKGHVHLNVSLQEKDSRSFVRFDIEDTGIGISKDRQDAIFESFTQADGSTSRKYGGTGLGLSITRKLTELLGGELTLTSQEGKGSVFSIMLPVKIANQSLKTTRSNGVESKVYNLDTINFSGRVLAVEDSEANQMLIRVLLEKIGLDVTIVENGKLAISQVEKYDYDLILMDIQMPVMNGYEATTQLRKNGIKTPIVALTASTMKGDEEKTFEAGFDEYISKPIDRRKLFKILDKYLSPTLQEKEHSAADDIDAITDEVDKISEICTVPNPSDGQQEQSLNVHDNEEVSD